MAKEEKKFRIELIRKEIEEINELIELNKKLPLLF